MKNNLFAELQLKLANEENLSLPYAAILAENALYRFEPAVREGVLLWLSGLLNADFAVDGKSIAEIHAEIGTSTFQSLCVLDILVKNAEHVRGAMWIIPMDRTHEMFINNPGVVLPESAIGEMI